MWQRKDSLVDADLSLAVSKFQCSPIMDFILVSSWSWLGCACVCVCVALISSERSSLCNLWKIVLLDWLKHIEAWNLCTTRQLLFITGAFRLIVHLDFTPVGRISDVMRHVLGFLHSSLRPLRRSLNTDHFQSIFSGQFQEVSFQFSQGLWVFGGWYSTRT